VAEAVSTRRVRASEVISWDVEADVVVVGFGIAGVSAALGAASVNSDVVVLERAGGSEGTCGGILYLGGGTPMQKAMGYVDSADNMYTFLLAALGPGVDEAKLRVYCDESLDHFEWLVANGVPLMSGADPEGSVLATPDGDGYVNVGGQEYAGGGLVWTGGEQAYPFDELVPAVPRGHIPRDEAGVEDLFEGAVLKCLIRSAERDGVAVEYNLGAQRLIVADDESIIGVEGRRFGNTVNVRARRGVILATGGFVYNDAMLRQHSPILQTVGKLGHDGQDGLGIQMAQAVGADVAHMDTADVTLVTTPPISHYRGILVNALGQRVINEDTYYGRLGQEAAFRQGAVAFLLLDEATFLESSWMRPAWAADSLAELEDEIGFPSGSLQQTVDFYNRHAKGGDDPLFHKRIRWLQPLDPPYAVIDLRQQTFPMSGFTLGGLRTNVAGEVLNTDSKPIVGLYAAGRATSGLAVYGYCSGISLGDGSFFGQRAGRSAGSRHI
jgi:3-oxo-5alpha-steroid 4-dehydrogenase